MTLRLLLALILLLCTASAGAALVLGIAPDSSSPLSSRSAAEALTGYLGPQLDNAVGLRIFRDRETLARALSRHREVDLALVSRDFYVQQQNGTLVHLVDFVPRRTGSGNAVMTLVARRGLEPALQKRLHELLLVMDTEPAGAEFLAGFSIEQYPSPQARIPLPQPAPTLRPSPVPASVKALPKTPQKVAKQPQPRPVEPPATASPPLIENLNEPQLTGKTVVEPPPSVTAPSPTQPAPVAASQPSRPPLLWIIAIILASGLLVKLLLLSRGRPRQRPLQHSPHLLIQHDWAELQGTPVNTATPAEVTPGGTTRSTETLQAKLKQAANPDPEQASLEPETLALPTEDLSLGGKLSSRQVPAMLQFIATSNRVGTLQVRSEHNEKRISFCRGKIVAASSVNLSNQNQSGFLMNKLGYLLVRQGKINEDDRDRALVLCEGDTNLRLGEALIRLGVIRREQLQQSLQDQAKMVLHSMIVFPEGEFQFLPEQVSVPQRDSLEISVADFLKEAAGHQSEWRSIRQLIPSLDCVLQFAPHGRQKINNSRMTVHQKFVLSLIDGKRHIHEICNEATMLDYELYRFLYLMVKAEILCLAD